MLDINSAVKVKEAINDYFCTGEELISLEAVCRMEAVPLNHKYGGYTILAHQYGDITIMVWVQFSENGIIVRKVKSQSW